jgi:MFS transporter, DHA3 family, macrolide efflux protein
MSWRELLGHRNYRLLFSGQVLSQLGDAIYEVGIVWLVWQLANAPAALGWLAVSQSLPFLLCGLFAGAYADRLDRRLTMLLSDVVRGGAVFYLWLRWMSGGLGVWEVCVVSVVLTVARAFFHPSMRAMFPQILPREALLAANGLSEGAKRLCKVGGMLVGGTLMASGRADAVLVCNAATFVVSALTVWMVRVPETGARREKRWQARVSEDRPRQTSASRAAGRGEGQSDPATAQAVAKDPSAEAHNALARRSLWVDIREAAREIGREKSVRHAILLSSAGLLVSAALIKIGLPLLAGNVLQGSGDVYGLLTACFSVGMFLSATSLKKFSRFSLMLLVPLGWAVYGAAFLLLGLGHSVWLAAPLVLLVGFAHFLTDIPVTTAIQQKMPMERMSACQSIWATASFGSESLSSLFGGVWLGLLSVSGGFMTAGAVLLILGGALLIRFYKNGQNTLDRHSVAE